MYEEKRKKKRNKQKKNKVENEMTPTASPSTAEPTTRTYNALEIPGEINPYGLSIPTDLQECILDILPERRTSTRRRKKKKRPGQKKRALTGETEYLDGDQIWGTDEAFGNDDNNGDDGFDTFDFENEEWDLYSATRNLVDTDTGLNQFGWNTTAVSHTNAFEGFLTFSFINHC